MLVLSRRRTEMVYLDFSRMTDAELLALRVAGPIRVVVDDIRGDKVRLGINAPTEIPVHRQEVYEAIQRENLRASRLDVKDAREVGRGGKPSRGPGAGS